MKNTTGKTITGTGVAVLKFCALIITLISLAIFSASCNSTENGTGNGAVSDNNAVTQAIIKADRQTLQVKINLKSAYVDENKSKTDEYCIIALPASTGAKDATNNVDIGKAEYIKKVRLQNTITVTVPLCDVTTRLYSSVALAIKSDTYYTLVTNAVYISNPEILAENREAYRDNNSIKGLKVDILTDAEELGVSKAIIEIPIEDYIAAAYSDSTLSYIRDGLTQYLNADSIDILDEKVKTLTNMGTDVYFRFVLKTNYSKLPSTINCLAFEGAAEAEYYAVNLTSVKSVNYVAGLLEFFAKRYAGTDGEHGFCGTYIIGTDVNNSATNSAGALTVADYTDNYVVFLRLADTALRSVYSNGRVFVSINNRWANTSNYVAADERDVSGNTFLEKIISICTKNGDFPWNLACAAFGDTLTASSIWNDSYDKTYTISPVENSLRAMTNIMENRSYQYKSKMRHIIIDKFGVNCPNGDTNAEQCQAASYAYAYFSCLKNGYIDALIYVAQTESVNIGATEYRMGMWECDVEGKPIRKREIYNIFANIDVYGKNNFNSIDSIIGSSYSSLYALYGMSEQKRVSVSGNEDSFSGKNVKQQTLYTFDKGNLNGFCATDGDVVTELAYAGTGDRVLRTYFPSEYLYKFSGVKTDSLSAGTIAGADYITLNLFLELPEYVSGNSDCTLRLILSQDGQTPVYYSAQKQIVRSAVEQFLQVTFNITEFTKSIDKKENINLSLELKNSGGQAVSGGICSVSVKSITAEKIDSATGVVITILIISVFAIAIICLIIYFFRNFEITTDPEDKERREAKRALKAQKAQNAKKAKQSSDGKKKTKPKNGKSTTANVKKAKKKDGYNYSDDYDD